MIEISLIAQSLNQIATFVKENQAESIDALEEKMKLSKDHISEYETQIKDLLYIFEGYVADTTAIISPIARNAMMRVDRNDIYFNLKQIESGINNNVTKAINITYKSPFSWAFWDGFSLGSRVCTWDFCVFAGLSFVYFLCIERRIVLFLIYIILLIKKSIYIFI